MNAPAKRITGASRIALPRLGEYWPEQGGIYCGRRADENDELYALIVARRADGEILQSTWSEALNRCAALRIDGFDNWTVPDRAQSLAMWQHLQQLLLLKDTDDAFADEWYWTSEPYASYAWCQSFDNGNQLHDLKYSQLRARAVRRLALQ